MDIGSSSVGGESGTSDQLSLSLKFKDGYTGYINSYVKAFDRAGGTAGWAMSAIFVPPNDFTLSQVSGLTTRQAGIAQGFGIAVTPSGSFGSPVSFACSAASGMTINCPTAVSTSGTGPYVATGSITATASAAVGTSNLNITASGANMSHPMTIPITVTQAPPPPSVVFSQMTTIDTNPGYFAYFTLSVTGQNGWTAPITFSVQSYFTGVSTCIVTVSGCGQQSDPVAVPGTIRIIMESFNQLPQSGEAYYFSGIFATPSGAQVANPSIHVISGQITPKFQLSLPTSLNVPAGRTTSTSLNVLTQGGYNSQVYLTSALKTASFSQITIPSVPGSSTVTIDPGSRPAGTVYNEIVYGNGDHGQPMTLTVTGSAGGAIRPQDSASTPSFYVYNNGQPKTWTYCLGYTGIGCVSGDTGMIDPTSLSTSCPQVSAKLGKLDAASNGGNGQTGYFDVEFTATRVAAGRSKCDLEFNWNGQPFSVTDAVDVYDASPQITSVQQFDQVQANGPFSISIYGTNFGPSPGSVVLCSPPSANPCNGTPDIMVSMDPHDPNFYWSDTQINVLLIPSPSASGDYDVVVNSSGEGGMGFAPQPGGGSQSQSNRGKATVWTVKGQVTLSSNGKGLSGTQISLSSSGAFAGLVQTDSNGRYSLQVPATGSYMLMPSFVGYWFLPKPPQTIGASQTLNFTAKPQLTVYLLHGIGQSSFDMGNLNRTLTDPVLRSGLDLVRFRVVSDFSFAECSKNQACAVSQYGDICSVDAGAKSLARFIIANPPPGDIILAGYSMGGIIARDLIANNYLAANVPGKIVGLITLGTPHLGYSYDPIDESVNCPQLDKDMAGGWLPLLNPPTELASSFLNGLNQQWQATSFPGYWLAAAGESCTNPTRNFPARGQLAGGCLSPSLSDGAVCRDSALYQSYIAFPAFAPPPVPTDLWEDPERKYVHTTTAGGWGSAFILCGNNPAVNQELFNPLLGGLLVTKIVGMLNDH